MRLISDLKIKILYYGLCLLENNKNTVITETLKALIVEYGKIYHLTIKPLKTAKKPLILLLKQFAAGSDITINEKSTDMQTLLNEFYNTINEKK